MRLLLLSGLLAGCATAGTEQPTTADAAPDGTSLPSQPDAAGPCNEVTTELLANPAFDSDPVGTMWMQTPINATYPLITGVGQTGTMGITEQSAPYDAWLGGLQGTDVLWQDITVPARTRLLALSGFYEVRSSDSASVVVDTGTLAFVQTNDSPIAVAQALDNTKRTTTWTTINYAVSNAETLSGMTIRVKMTTTNNAPNPITGAGITSFWWDTLSVKATHCM
jgi:hypothetical protein